MNRGRLVLLIGIALSMVGFFAFDLHEYLTLESFQTQQARIDTYHSAHPIASAAAFFAIYVAVTGLSLPGAALMTLIAGAIFGLLWGIVIVSFASSIGATLAFLVSRFLLRDWVQARFGDRLKTIYAGIDRDGAFYLFALRLVPALPFFVINLVMGLTSLSTRTFFWVSQVGMLAGTVVFINAGTQIGQLRSIGGILSPGLLASFALLGLFPFLARWLMGKLRARKMLRAYPRPKHFDRNLVVIGGGSAGLVSAYIAAAVKAKVTLIEKHQMGGDCLNTGCVPSKALLRSAKFLAQIKRAEDYGCKSAQVDFDFADIMQRVQRVVATVAPHDSIQRYTSLGVECIKGEARIVSPYSVEVDGRTLTTRGIIVAAGARPFVPSIPGLDDVGYLTSDTVWGLRTLPARLLVLGGGPIGCELAQAFARCGSKVTVLQRQARLMMREDAEIAEMVMTRFTTEGIDLCVGHTAKEFRLEDGHKVLICASTGSGKESRIEFDQLLLAVGRTANTAGYGLEELGITLNPSGTIRTDAYLQTDCPTIYACGDVAGPYQFTHTAAHQAWYASVNALFGGFKRFKADYTVIPWATFTDPEVARVGLNEQEAKAKSIDYEVTRYGIDDLDRAITDEEAHGVVKVLSVPGKDRILGVTIVGEHAGDLIAEYVAAMRHGIGLNKILGTIHIYPTLAEANKFAAGAWKRAHAPARILRWVERFHAWRRGKVDKTSPRTDNGPAT